MAIGTYTELQAAVANWIDRSDLTLRIPEFIALAEAQMNRELRVRRMISRATATISDEYSAVPSDFVGVRSIAIRDEPLNFVDQGDIVDMIDRDTSTGQPIYYSVVGGEIRYYPRPDASYTAKMAYWAKIPALTTTNTTNWVLTSHPDAYLYGSLLHHATYNRDAEMMATAGGAFTSALEAIRDADASETFGDRRRLKRPAFG